MRLQKYILFNLKRLLSLNHFFVLSIYISFAWFLSQPPLDTFAIHNSERLVSNYDRILLSIAFLNFLVFIMAHFNQEMKKGRLELLTSRFSMQGLFWAMICCYLIYFIVGFLFPFYGTACVQQYLSSTDTVDLSVYFMKFSIGLTGYILFWIVITIGLFVWLRNDFVVLIIIIPAYLFSIFLNVISDGLYFNQHWIDNIVLSKNSANLILNQFFFWLFIILITILIGNFLIKKIPFIDFSPPYRTGLFARLANFFKAYLSKHHLNMMGFANQKILTLFSLIGLIFIIFIVRNPNAQMIVLAKVYLGAFIPILFSFNQFYIIEIDRDAGMIHNNFIRGTEYFRIILNRWFLLLIPQLIISALYSFVVSLSTEAFSISIIIYILLLNIFCSSFNLFFAIKTRTNITANLILIFSVYLMLRDDVQSFLISYSWLNKLNIFYVLLQDKHVILLEHWIISLVLIFLFLFLTKLFLQRIGYVVLESY